ncbi:MAG: 4Fe-4S binding protein [Deltaproteobacteria bacterium]|nr:4Fe-4S binding protein [Deltaproteobacteria bacterium]
MAVIIDERKCTGCERCVQVCPVDAITVNKVAKVDKAICIDCGSCIDECPKDAIFMAKTKSPPSLQNAPAFPAARVPSMRKAAIPPSTRPSWEPRGLQWASRDRLLLQILDLFGRRANPGRGRGYGRGRRCGRSMGRGKGRWG